MSLRLIYGRSGTGKSEYCFKEIAKLQNKEKIYMITPNQNALMSEKKMMEEIEKNTLKADLNLDMNPDIHSSIHSGINSSINSSINLDIYSAINSEVITFNRMAYRVRNELGGAKKTNLTKSGKAMLIYDILSNEKENLTFLGKNAENVDIIGNAITEFKKHNVDINQIKVEIDKTDDEYLKLKLKDMVKMYEAFQNSIADKFLDENDTLDILNEQIMESTQFKDSIIYIDEFVGFTKQEYQIIAKLMKLAKEVNVTICTDKLQQLESQDKDIFFSNKNTALNLLQIASDNNIKVEDDVILKTKYRYKSDELSFLEENIYSVPYHIYRKNKNYINNIKSKDNIATDVSNLKLFLANNQYSEIEHVATQISKLIRNGKYRYNEISVITQNLDIYSSLIKVIFNSYNIPVFIDEKKELADNIIVKLLISILDIFNKNWSFESVFNYIKSGFVFGGKENKDDIEEIYKLENYCIRWGIKGKKWYQKDWEYYGNNEYSEEEVETFNELRKQIVEPLKKLEKVAKKSMKTKDLTRCLYDFLQELNIEDKLKNKINDLNEKNLLELANEYETSYKVLMELFDEIVLVFNDEKINFEKYMEILKIGLKNTGLGKIPASQDQVIVGDVSRSRTHKVKAVFIIGINDGQFPGVHREEGFFNDKDREKLKSEGIELAKGSLENLYEDNFNIYKALTVAENKLYLSYASSDNNGKSLRPSIIISKIKKIFPELEEESDIITKPHEIITKNSTFDNLVEKLYELSEKDIEIREDSEIEKDNDSGTIEWIEALEYFENDEEWKGKLSRSLEGLNYTNKPKKIKKEFVEKMYGKKLHTTISRLEKYSSCPFSYYLEYGLKLKEKPELQLRTIDTGSFMHDIIDTFFKNLEKNGKTPKDLDDEDVEKIIDKIIEDKLNLKENYIFKVIPKFIIQTNRLKKVVKLSIKYIVKGLKQSDFKIAGNEVEFKEGARFEPIKLKTKTGKEIEITGKIDRMDIAKDINDLQYVRIIDYKSSAHSIDLNEVLAGLQLQLLTYLDAVCDVTKVMPSGILYFKLDDPMISVDKNMTDEELNNAIKEKFKMNGIVLADIDVAIMMDNNLKIENKSFIIPVSKLKNGEIRKSTNTASREQFETLQRYVKYELKKLSEEMLSGDIRIAPTYNSKKKQNPSPCGYCKFNAICNFKQGSYGNEYNYLKKYGNDQAIKIMSEKIEPNEEVAKEEK